MAWKDLSIRDKAAYIASSVASGNFNLNRIKEDFNSNLERFKNADANFVQRLNNNDTRSIIGSDGRPQTHRLGWEYEGNHAIIYPEVQDNSGVLEHGDLQSAIERRDTIHTSIPFARYYTRNYKKDYPEFFNEFDDGGKKSSSTQRLAVADVAKGFLNSTVLGRKIRDNVRKKLYNNVYPSYYDGFQERVVNALSNNARTENEGANSPHGRSIRDDIWAEYLQIPQEERYDVPYAAKVETSEYAPTIGSEDKEYKKIQLSDEDKNALIVEALKTGNSSTSTVLSKYFGSHTIGHGFDDKGEYVSYYDLWDINPNYGESSDTGVQNKLLRKYIDSMDGKDISLGIGNPIEFYDRIYLDDYFGVEPELAPDEFYGGYIRPAFVGASKDSDYTVKGSDYDEAGLSLYQGKLFGAGGSANKRRIQRFDLLAYGGNLFSGKDKNQPTQKMHMWGEFDYPEATKPSANKYERISNDRYNSAFNALTNAGYKGGDADRLAQILASQSITETGWVDKNDTHNYAGYLNSKGKLIKYDSPEHFWSDHISNLSSKWPEWNTANNTDEYFDIVNHTNLGLNTLDKFNRYNKTHRDNPVYIYAPDWQNQNYSGRMKSVSKRASKYFPKKLGPIY